MIDEEFQELSEEAQETQWIEWPANAYSWLRYGIENGYCTDVYCQTHEGYHHDDLDVIEELWPLYDGDHCWYVSRVKSATTEAANINCNSSVDKKQQ